MQFAKVVNFQHLSQYRNHLSSFSTSEDLQMSKISSSLELYVGELKDLWCASDQMALLLCKVAPQAQNPKLQSMLKESQADIAKHTEIVKSLIEAKVKVALEKNWNEMEGLVANKIKYMIEEAPEPGSVLDAAIIAQCRAITHYGIRGFGKVWGFAKALQLADDQTKLQSAIEEMYQSDKLMNELAEKAFYMQAA